ncbi:hypothetical protein D9M71_388090 [compost metagenome]
MRRHGAAHFTHNGVQQLRLLEQHRTTARLVHSLGRATEVQVDHRRPKLASQCGVFRQAYRVRTQQLHAHGHTGSRARALTQFRRQLVERGRRQQAVAHANELGDAPVDTAHTGQYVAQDVVDQPLHRGQSNLHVGVSAEKAGSLTKMPATQAPISAGP